MQVSHPASNKNQKLTFPTRDDIMFVRKEGKWKAFHTGSNSFCHVHICQHYTLYQERCKEENIPVHHWAILHPIWNEAKEAQKHSRGIKQAMLDLVIVKKVAPKGFT